MFLNVAVMSWALYFRGMGKVKSSKRRGKAAMRKRSAGLRKKRRGPGKPFEPENAYRFPKGVSGNPGGRPKGLGGAVAKIPE